MGKIGRMRSVLEILPLLETMTKSRSYCDKKKSDKRAGLGGKKEMHRMMMPKTKENFKNTQETLPDMLAWQKLVSLMKYCIRSVGPS